MINKNDKDMKNKVRARENTNQDNHAEKPETDHFRITDCAINADQLRDNRDNCSSVSLLSLNVCGIKNRLLYPEFRTLINSFDVLCLTETKLDDCDTIECEEFIFKFKNRHKITNYRSGGIALGYKRYLEKFIRPIESECNFVYWFQVDKAVFNLDKNVIFGVVYIPPVNTRYASDDALNEFESEFQRFYQNTENIVLVGDFNSRTGNLQDYYDDNLDNFLLKNPEQMDYLDVYKLDKLHMQRNRNSPDTVVNGYGRKFIDFCKNNMVYILNGRFGHDVFGRPTSKNNSVVDYIACTANILECVIDFEVFNFSKLYSDVHTPLSLQMRKLPLTDVNETVDNCVSHEIKIKKWDSSKKEDFMNNIDRNRVESVIFELSNIVIEDVTSNDINACMAEISNILLESAKNTFGTFNVTHTKSHCSLPRKQNKDWFNSECHKARKEFRKSKRLYKHYGSNLFKIRLRYSEKNYKDVMNRNIKRYNENISNEMKTLRSKNPKEFWKIFNKHRKRVTSDISMESLFQFFRDLNKNHCENEYNIEPNLDSGSLNDALNG